MVGEGGFWVCFVFDVLGIWSFMVSFIDVSGMISLGSYIFICVEVSSVYNYGFVCIFVMYYLIFDDGLFYIVIGENIVW